MNITVRGIKFAFFVCWF